MSVLPGLEPAVALTEDQLNLMIADWINSIQFTPTLIVTSIMSSWATA